MRLVTDFLVDDGEELWLSNCPSMTAVPIPRTGGGGRKGGGARRGEGRREYVGEDEQYDDGDDKNDSRGNNKVIALDRSRLCRAQTLSRDSQAESGLADKYSMVPDVSSVHFRTVLLAKISETLPALPMKEKKRLSRSAMRRRDEEEKIDVRGELFRYKDLLSVPVEVSASEGKLLAEFERSMRHSFSESKNGARNPNP